MSNAIRYVIIEEPVYNDLVGTLDIIIVQLDRINVFLEPKNRHDKTVLVTSLSKTRLWDNSVIYSCKEFGFEMA
jgi:hypothetical protein